MGRPIIQIARGDFSKFPEHLHFGELFLDTNKDKLYIGASASDQIYELDLSKVSELPLKIGRISLEGKFGHGSSAALSDEWQEFQKWKAEKDK